MHPSDLIFTLFFLFLASSPAAAQHVHTPEPAPMCSEVAPVLAEAAATCTGAANCKACKNCKYCGHCSKKGKSCGVCNGAARSATATVLQPWRSEPDHSIPADGTKPRR